MVNPPLIVESGQPPHRNRQPVKETELGGIQDEDAEGDIIDEETYQEGVRGAQSRDETTKQLAEEANESDRASQHSKHSLAKAATRAKEAEVTKTILLPLSDDEDYSWLDEIPKKKTVESLPQIAKTPARPVLYRSKTAPIESSEPPLSTQVQSIEPATKANTNKKSENQKNKRAPPDDSDDDEKNVRNHRWKGSKGRLTMAESMLEQAVMEDARFKGQAKEDREASERRFQQEQQQRDQHHAAEMAHSQVLINESQERANESKERLLRLQLELAKQQQSQGFESYDSNF